MCNTCCRCFLIKSVIAKHAKTYLLGKPYLYSYCGKGLVAVDTLQTHLKIDTKADLLACLVCGDKFAAQTSLQLHLRKHTGERPHLCSVCRLRFKSSSQLRGHQARHFGLKSENVKFAIKDFQLFMPNGCIGYGILHGGCISVANVSVVFILKE
ncbi:hypothetical protein MTP99_009772 [Tenebrio molitor]|nr:hypothetical protein MTP99_009772 [Tenebrio molitor]